jgi:hypothetical protein
MKKKNPKPPTRRERIAKQVQSWYEALERHKVTHEWIVGRYVKEATFYGEDASHGARVSALDKLSKLKGEPPPGTMDGMLDMAGMSTADLVRRREALEKEARG